MGVSRGYGGSTRSNCFLSVHRSISVISQKRSHKGSSNEVGREIRNSIVHKFQLLHSLIVSAITTTIPGFMPRFMKLRFGAIVYSYSDYLHSIEIPKLLSLKLFSIDRTQGRLCGRCQYKVVIKGANKSHLRRTYLYHQPFSSTVPPVMQPSGGRSNP